MPILTHNFYIVVTHEMQFAREVSNVVLFFNDCIIEKMGNPDDLFTNPKSDQLKAFLKRTNSPVYT